MANERDFMTNKSSPAKVEGKYRMIRKIPNNIERVSIPVS